MHAQEQQEDEKLQKFIMDQTKRTDQSNSVSKQTSKSKEVVAPVSNVDRRKGLPVKTTVSAVNQ